MHKQRLNSKYNNSRINNNISQLNCERQKQLQKEFLENSKELSKNNKKNSIPKEIKNVNNALEVENNINKKLQLANKKIQELKQAENKSRNKINKLKNNLFGITKELETIKNENANLHINNESYITKINELSNKIYELEQISVQMKASYILKEREIKNENARKIKNFDSKNDELKREISLLNENIYKLEVENFKITFSDRITIQKKHYYKTHIEELQNTINKLNIQLKELEDEYQKKLSNLNYQNRLRINLNPKLKKEIQLLDEEYEQKLRFLINNDCLSQIEDSTDLKPPELTYNISKTYLYGTLKSINSIIYFISIEGKMYEAELNNIEFKEDSPCKGVLETEESNSIKIEEVYNESANLYNSLSEKHKLQKKVSTKEFKYKDLDYENKYNVLIIGSRYKETYTKALNRIGLNVTWFDSYKSNFLRLKNIVDKNHIIICCQDHSRHYATNFITKLINSDTEHYVKYNILANENVEKIVGRIRYVIENM